MNIRNARPRRPMVVAAGFFLALMVSAALAAPVLGLGGANPVPLINQPLAPATVAPGSAGFTLTVNGTGFVSGASVQWNGGARTTAFVSGSQLTAQILSSDVSSAGTAAVTVSNPAPGGGASNTEYFTVANSHQVFFSNSSLAAGNFANSVVVADFNGDGKPDIACVNGFDATVGIFLGNADGTFQPQQTYPAAPAGADPFGMVAADMNGDGKLDLVVSDNSADMVSVLLGNGDGTFQAPREFAVGSLPQAVAVADFNGDGKLDVAVANGHDNTISMLLGNGDGTLQGQVAYSTEISPSAIFTGDFNNDGNIDLAVANGCGDDPQCSTQSTATVSIFLGKGDGTFPTRADYDGGGGLADFLTGADLNGDGTLDLVLDGDGGFCVFLGKGDGTFQPPVNYVTHSRFFQSVIADLNGDGILDIATGFAAGTDQLAVSYGNGNGTFQNPVLYPAAVGQYVAVGDFNNDGQIDIVSTSPLSENQLTILLQSAGATAVLAPASLTFGSFGVGITSPPQTVDLSNTGTGPLLISSITFTGADPTEFAETNNCGNSLGAGATCMINVTFTPAQNGMRTAALTLTDNASGSPQTVPVSGTGLGPVILLSPTDFTFGSQLVNQYSPTQHQGITNSGAADLIISSVTVTGEFTIVNHCSTIGPGEFCSFPVAFKPTSIGSKTGVITITDNAPGSPHLVPLSGAGTVVSFSPTSLVFDVPVGQSGSMNITMTNHALLALHITGFKILERGALMYSQTNNCGNSLASKASCTITVTFSPTVKGTANAIFNIFDNGGGSPQAILFSGTGL